MNGQLTTSIVSIVIGIVLAALAIFMGVSALTPSADQSDAPLIVYGDS